MMKYVINVFLVLIILVLGWQLFQLYIHYSNLKNSAQEIDSQINFLKNENNNLTADIDYFSNPENLEKEVKSKTNYRLPDEKTIIIIPSSSSTVNQ